MGQRETSPVCTWHFFVANKLISWGFSPALASVRSRLLELILAGNSSYTSAVQVSARWSRNGAEREERDKGSRNISPSEKLVTAHACLWENLCIPATLLRCRSSVTRKKTCPRWPISKKKKKKEIGSHRLFYIFCALHRIHIKGSFTLKICFLFLWHLLCENANVLFIARKRFFQALANDPVFFSSIPIKLVLLKSPRAQTR